MSAGYGSALDLIIHYLSWEISVIPKTDRPIHFFCHVTWSVLFDSPVSSTMDLLTELGHGGSRD